MAVRSRIQQLRGTAADWAQKNPVLLAGEVGVELDTGFQKVGNGVQPWNDRPYQRGPKGDTGAQGIPGVKGDQGVQGVPGVKGDTGLKGDTGAKGDTGTGLQLTGRVATYALLPAGAANGAQYLVDADGLVYIKANNAWPANGAGVQLRGPKGDQGVQGVAGAKGDQGVQGVKGDQGPAGVAPANVVLNGGGVATIVTMTQAQYNALGAKVASTLYVIVG